MRLVNPRLVVVVSLLAASSVLAAPPDGLLTARTKLSLWTTAGVRSGAVHVDTTDGVVTLYGKVPTSEHRALAEKTARAVGGVRSVTNRLQVVPDTKLKETTRTDGETRAAVEKALSSDERLEQSSIQVKSVDKGVVLLTGKARTVSDHLRAIMLADRVVGVARVATEVTDPGEFVGDETTATPNGSATVARSSAQDLATTTGVKLRLWTATEVPSTEIGVDTNDGHVTLFGIVPTAAVKASAGAEAAKVNGVLHVDNLLEVVSTAQKAKVDAKDTDISKDLALALKDHPEASGVTTSVKNGVVQLTGTVDSSWDELTLVRVARSVRGVRAVEDQLRIAPR